MAVFYSGKPEAARAQATWVELTSPTAYDSALTGKDGAGKTTLTKLLLKKNPRALPLKSE
jgi:ABC-type transport system involved in cytochrome bd biosynthesis fused ATPase/permease subunit